MVAKVVAWGLLWDDLVISSLEPKSLGTIMKPII